MCVWVLSRMITLSILKELIYSSFSFLCFKAEMQGRSDMSLVMRKPDFCISDQLHGNREADQRLCFRYTDGTIPLLPKSGFSNL